MHVQPYLFFEGRCEEALEFYKSAIGAKVGQTIRYKDSPVDPSAGCEGSPPPPDKIMHTSFAVGESTILASDGECNGSPSFAGFSLTIYAADAAEADKYFSGLADGGKVQMPLSETFFASRFGMVTDKFGVAWMVMVQKS